MKYAIALALSVLLPGWSALAVEAAGNSAIEVRVTAEVEVKTKTEDGREEVKRVPLK